MNYEVIDVLNMLKFKAITEKNQHLLVVDPMFCRSFLRALDAKLIEPTQNKIHYFMNLRLTERGECIRKEENEK